MIIRKLTVANVKRLKDATFVPPEDASLVVVAGNNAQGKSSALDSICMVLGGASFDPIDPIRHGEERASAEVDLGEFKAKCVWTKKGRRLEVVDKADPDGKVAGPQTFLDRLVGPLSFDPLAFMRETPKEQARILSELLGIDFAQADTARADALADRLMARRDKAAANGRYGELAAQITQPGVIEVSLTDLANELQAAIKATSDRADLCRFVVDEQNRLSLCEKKIAELEAELARERFALVSIGEHMEKSKREVDACPVVDLDAIRRRMATAEETNKQARLVQELKKAENLSNDAEKNAAVSDAKIAKIDRWKKQQLAEAAFPIPGLAFADDGTGLLLNNVPLSQCSDSEKLKVGVGIGLRLTKEVKVMMIRDGSLLDDDSMAEVERMAAEADVQIWVERVGQDGPATWVIEDGRIMEAADESFSD